VAGLPSATLIPSVEYTSISNTWIGNPVIECNFKYLAFGKVTATEGVGLGVYHFFDEEGGEKSDCIQLSQK
jgi:hypothetical protein